MGINRIFGTTESAQATQKMPSHHLNLTILFHRRIYKLWVDSNTAFHCRTPKNSTETQKRKITRRKINKQSIGILVRIRIGENASTPLFQFLERVSLGLASGGLPALTATPTYSNVALVFDGVKDGNFVVRRGRRDDFFSLVVDNKPVLQKNGRS